MADEKAPQKPQTNLGKLLQTRPLRGVDAAKNPDALAAWVNYKRNQAKRSA